MGKRTSKHNNKKDFKTQAQLSIDVMLKPDPPLIQKVAVKNNDPSFACSITGSKDTDANCRTEQYSLTVQTDNVNIEDNSCASGDFMDSNKMLEAEQNPVTKQTDGAKEEASVLRFQELSSHIQRNANLRAELNITTEQTDRIKGEIHTNHSVRLRKARSMPCIILSMVKTDTAKEMEGMQSEDIYSVLRVSELRSKALSDANLRTKQNITIQQTDRINGKIGTVYSVKSRRGRSVSLTTLPMVQDSRTEEKEGVQAGDPDNVHTVRELKSQAEYNTKISISEQDSMTKQMEGMKGNNDTVWSVRSSRERSVPHTTLSLLKDSTTEEKESVQFKEPGSVHGVHEPKSSLQPFTNVTAELNFTGEQIVTVKEEADTVCSISNSKSPLISNNITMEQDSTTNQTLIIKEELVLTDDSLRECDPLNVTFAEQQTLKQESDNFAGEPPELDSSDPDNSNECKVCHMKYVSADGLLCHSIKFSNPRFPCRHCGTKFSNFRQLRQHISHTHTISKYTNSAKCPVCSQRFKFPVHIQSHLWHFHEGWDKKSNEMILPSKIDVFENSLISNNNDNNVENKLKNDPEFEISLSEKYDDLAPTNTLGKTGPLLSNGIRYLDNDEFPKLTNFEIRTEDSSYLSDVIKSKPDNESEESESSNITEYSTDNFVTTLMETNRDSGDDEKCNNIQQEAFRNTADGIGDEIARAEKLRALYSCEDCYVPLTKITVQPNNTIKVVTKDDGTVGFTHVPKKPYRPLMELAKMIACIPETIDIPIKTEPFAYDSEFLDEFEETTKSEGSEESEGTEELEGSAESKKAEESEESKVSVDLERSVKSKRPTYSFACMYCDANFLKKLNLDKHVQKFHTVIRSIICNKLFRSRESMMKHYRHNHFKQERTNSTCVCGKKLNSYKELFNHFYQYLEEIQTGTVPATSFQCCKPLPKKFWCAKCDEGFWLKTCLSHHVNKCVAVPSEKVPSSEPVDENEDDKLICEVCNVKFLNTERLKSHKHAFNGPAIHPCPVCGTKFNGLRRLGGHIRATHEVSKSIYTCFCSICNQGFTQQLYRRMHIAHTHDKLERMNTAGTIGISHLDTIDSDDPEGEDELYFKCKVCGIVFKNRKRFIEHVTYYKKNEIITCTACRQSFEGQYNAHHHNKMVHYSPKIRINIYVYHCKFCREGFAFETHLSAHIAHVHANTHKSSIDQSQIDQPESSQSNLSNKPNENLSARRYPLAVPCEICEMKFTSLEHVEMHKSGYQNGGDFMCDKCAKTFPTSEKLLIHLSVNHSTTSVHKGAICRHCGEGFTSRAFWLAHIKHLHNIRQPSEFYFEKNILSALEFGHNGFAWIPRNLCIDRRETYKDISNMLDELSKVAPLGNKVNRDSNNQEPIRITELQSEDNKIKIPDNHTSGSDIVSAREHNKLNGEKNWECVNCGIFCDGPAQLAKHFKSCVNIGDYPCEQCGRKFTWLKLYMEHKQKHLQSQPVNHHLTPIGKQGFQSTQDIKMHTALIKPKPLQSCIDPEPLQSLIDTEPSQWDMLDDSKSQLQTEIFEEEPFFAYECPDCTDKFSTLYQLLKHTRINHAPRINRSRSKYQKSESTIEAMEDKSQTRERPGILKTPRADIHKCLSTPSVSSMTVIQRDSLDKHNYAKTAVQPNSVGSSDNVGFRGPSSTLKSTKTVLASNSIGSQDRLGTQVKGTTNKISKHVGLSSSLIVKSTKTVLASKGIGSHHSKGSAITTSNHVGLTLSLLSNYKQVAVTSNPIVSPVKSSTHLEGTAKIVSKNVGSSSSSISYNKKAAVASSSNVSPVKFLNYSEGTAKRISKNVGLSPSLISNHKETVVPLDGIESLVRILNPSESTSDNISTHVRLLPSSNSNADTTDEDPLESDSSLAEKSQVGLLKVRSFANVAQKLNDNTYLKRKLSPVQNSIQNENFLAKKQKKVFDPIFYAELCRQHNIEPPPPPGTYSSKIMK